MNTQRDRVIQLKGRKKFYSRNMIFINILFILRSFFILSTSYTLRTWGIPGTLFLRFAIFVDDSYRTI